MANQALIVGSYLIGPIERFFLVQRHTEAWLTEEQMRACLADAGLDEQEINRQFVRARAMRRWMDEHYVERPTTLGYCNEHGQTVLRRTDEPGQAPFQRVFILKCRHCGHEHGVDGCAIPGQRCPICQRH